MKKLYASDLLNKRIEDMYDVIKVNEPRHRTARNYKATLPTIERLEVFAHDNDIKIDVRENTNLGVIVEAMIKAHLNKGDSLSMQGQTDLVTGGKRFDIKLLIQGSTSYPSSINLHTLDDVLFVTNDGVKIMRNHNIKVAYEKGYMNKRRRFTGKVLDSGLLEETAFTKRLTQEMGL